MLILTRKIFIGCVLCSLLSFSAFGNENREPDSTADIGLASVWAMGEITQGGFIKTDAALIAYDKNINSMLSLYGGWRFTKHLKLGFTLAGTLSTVKQVGSKIITIGPAIGYSDFNQSIGRYSVDVIAGAAYAGESDGTLFIEPGFNLLKHIPRYTPKHLLWSVGMSYRKFQNIDSNLSGKNNLNSFNLKIGLVFGTY